MAERKWKIGKMQIVFFKSERWVMYPIAAVIVFSMAALIALGWAEYQFRHRTEALRAEAAQVEYENEVLEKNTMDLGSVQSIERIAREELGMVSPDTVLIEAQVK